MTKKNSWSLFIDATARGEYNNAIAERTGVDPATIGRWRTGAVDPKPRQVVAYARAYGESPIQALIAAGYLDAQDLDIPLGPPRTYTLDDFSTLELAEEVVSRLESGEGFRTTMTVGEPTTVVMDAQGNLTPVDDVPASADDDHADEAWDVSEAPSKSEVALAAKKATRRRNQ